MEFSRFLLSTGIALEHPGAEGGLTVGVPPGFTRMGKEPGVEALDGTGARALDGAGAGTLDCAGIIALGAGVRAGVKSGALY